MSDKVDKDIQDLNDYEEELEFFRSMALDKLKENELHVESLERILDHVYLCGVGIGRIEERYYKEEN